MLKITLATNTERRMVLVGTSATINEITIQNGITLVGHSVYFAGRIIPPCEYDYSLADLGAEDGMSYIMNITVKEAACAIKVAYENSVLTVKTEIALNDFPDVRTVKDSAGNDIYAVSISDNASLSEFEFRANTTIDGYLSAVMVMPMGTALDDVKRAFRKELVAADKYTSEIAEAIKAETAKVNEIFAN